ncbi:AraC family transcriptional regulator [Labrys monachus]|uniref:AraC-like DNA-binding protein n=1 Tax=Labrys monachus TaxID=217067 RepID=A0ABU0FET8_9HYPH|nr:AraC family transcriptional regulator [Labrys monachus]MDQ0393129.1 AraC-like DNA-binding protein [Labrys monachus]
MKPHDSDHGVLAPASDFRPSNDLLSDVLRFVQLSGERVFTAELGPGFDVLFQPGAACIHVIQQGSIDIEAEGGSPLRLSAGDIAVLPHAVQYTLSDGPRRGPNERTTLEVGPAGVQAAVLRHGSGSPVARTISATFQFENKGGVSPLLKLLPDIIHIARDADQSAVLIRDVAQFLVLETTEQEPGAALMISRVIDILIIRSLRTWARSLGTRQGWIGALADARVSRAVAALHRDPTRSWTVEDLASVAGMSRSRFAELFLEAVGEPPLRYLHRWRLAMASDLLRRSTLPVGEIAHSIGYESEAAFSRAFKTMFGTTPRDARSAH